VAVARARPNFGEFGTSSALDPPEFDERRPSQAAHKQDGGMLLADLVATSGAVAATRARSAKVAALADLLARVGPDEVVPAVAMLTGVPHQGRIGVGWRTMTAIDVPPAGTPALAVADVDRTLDEIAACAGTGSAGARTRLLSGLLGAATADEQSFLRRLLTGELRQGALEGLMTDAIARASGTPLAAVRRAAMLTGDLCRTAELALTAGEGALGGVALEVGRPVLPMLASTAVDVAGALADLGTASVEWKLDGARIQVHRDGDAVGIFTRNLNDVTARLPGIVAAVRAMPVTSLVLDGEAIGVHEDERPGMFQDTMSRFGRHDGQAGASLGARFFDVLHVDGEDLLDRPLHERLTVLDSVVAPFQVPRLVTEDPDEGAEFLTAALDAGHEGVMVKAVSSLYEAGRRGRRGGR
jgi:DNA ligase-1